MQLLTLDDQTFLMDRVPDKVDEDMRFAVLDNSDTANPDFFFVPLIYLESFSSPSAVLEIGGNKIQMPLDWHILLGDPDCGDLEIVPLTSLNDRSFHAFCFNPISDSMPRYQEVRITNIYNEVEWFFPRVKSNQLITIPTTSNKSPQCAYFIKEINRNTDMVNLNNLFHA
tara:strand:+ start:11713 stop:12222 length:510 start_codon:yes stop_codon:yes gene_type:complete